MEENNSNITLSLSLTLIVKTCCGQAYRKEDKRLGKCVT